MRWRRFTILKGKALISIEDIDRYEVTEVMKMSVKKARKLRVILLLSGFVIMLLAYYWEPFFGIGAAVAVSSLIPHFLYNKCPYCGKQLGRNEGNFCQFCGKQLDD